MTTKEKIICSVIKLSQRFFFEEMYEGQYGEFICGYRGLKGLIMEVQLYTCKFLANYKTLERTR